MKEVRGRGKASRHGCKKIDLRHGEPRSEPIRIRIPALEYPCFHRFDGCESNVTYSAIPGQYVAIGQGCRELVSLHDALGGSGRLIFWRLRNQERAR